MYIFLFTLIRTFFLYNYDLNIDLYEILLPGIRIRVRGDGLILLLESDANSSLLSNSGTLLRPHSSKCSELEYGK